MRVIYEENNHRIIELPDIDYSIENIEGDSFNPDCNPDIDEEDLARQREAFYDRVSEEGVFGYIQEKWCPQVGCGWVHVDSCWGFVGQFSESEEIFNHYIVNEMKNQIKGV